MRQIFEEYGKFLVAIVAAAAVLGLLLGGLNFFGLIGESIENVDTEISNSQSSGALNSVISRQKPKADFDAVNLHLYKNVAFRPLDGVRFTDINGNEIDCTVTAIDYYDSTGEKKELIAHYNREKDYVILNPEHYTGSHLECNASEFAEDTDGDLIISGAENCPGIVIVTYMAMDSEHQVAVEELTFIVDNKAK